MSYPKVEIGHLVEKVETWNPKKGKYPDSFTYVDLSSLDKDRKIINIGLTPQIKSTEAPSRARQLIQESDILISTVRPNLNGVAIVPQHLDGATASTGYCVLRTTKALDPLYLFYWTRTQSFIQDMVSKSTGANYPAVSDKIIKQSKIPLPPIDEQKVIVKILALSDSITRKNKRLVESYDLLIQSLFMDMFGTPSNNVHNFELGTVKDLISSVNYGTSAKADIDGEYSYLRMNNITYQGYMDYQDLKYINLSENDKPKYLVEKGDILFNRTNSKELVGKTGLYNEEHAMAIAGYLIRVRVNQKANPYYLWRFMNSSYCKSVLSHMCKSIVGMANINAQELQKIQILLPPIELQNKFADRIKEIEAQKEIALQSLKKSEELFNSLLQQAFKGELTQTECAN